MRPQRSRRRAGYTLLELLLALVVLAVLVGVSLPGALRLYGDSRLSEAAELVRMQVAGTRTRAIDGGLTYQFRYEPDGRYFLAAPFEREVEGTDSTAIGTGVTTGVGKFSKFAGELPEGFRFIACCTGGAMGGQVTEELLEGLPNAGKLASLSWSPPILFSPNGTAMDSAFELSDPRNQTIRFEIRGLTGAVKLGPITSEAKL
jgi:prepilin-type N-terminal cleavage/methylation domain-containing protein